jgi:cytochrome c biogenesis protein CcmG/thiol:disulfide interchange protein DsbE
MFVAAIALAGFYLADPKQLPSALLHKPFPQFSAPVLGEPGRQISRDDLVGRVLLVNVWATWCPTCLAEHGELQRIAAETGLPIIGLNYKDDPVRAQAWLRRYGNPYEYNIVDLDGQLGIELGVYGAPETFLLNATGEIVYKRVGDINPRIWELELEPLLRSLEAI